VIRGLSFVVTALLLTGCSHKSGSLGALVEGTAVTVASITSTPVDKSIVLQGSMTKKCPVAGCWFVLQDQTGTIKVDTKNAGFAVVDVPLNSKLFVAGRVTTNGAERFIDASGVRF